MSTPDKMTRGERVELGQLIRKRERLMKAMAVERSAEMLAEFETQCAAIYSFDQDEVWNEAMQRAEQIVAETDAVIAERCKELNIPSEFAPSVNIAWYSRGQNAVAVRQFLERMPEITTLMPTLNAAEIKQLQDGAKA